MKIYRIALNELKKLLNEKKPPNRKQKLPGFQPLRDFLANWRNDDKILQTWDDNFLNTRHGLSWFANVTGYNARDFREDGGWTWDITKGFLDEDVFYMPIKQQEIIYDIFTGKKKLGDFWKNF
jgi:hypothetical protein